MMHAHWSKAAAAGALFAASALTVSACGSAVVTSEGSWEPAGKTTVNSLTGAEGIASRANGSLVHRGLSTIPASVRLHGFDHIGDLDISHGDTFDSYQGLTKKSAKMFLVTTSTGKSLEYKHPLDPGELFNNSFDAVSPDGQWLVSGEFGAQKRLQVFPAPLLNPSTPQDGGTLKHAGQITLDTTVTNVQGCDFFSGTRLICTSDDAAKDVFRVDLPHALDGKQVDGTVTNVLTLPQVSKCRGTFEAEGVDYDPTTRILRAAIVPPGLCKTTTTVFSFHWKTS